MNILHERGEKDLKVDGDEKDKEENPTEGKNMYY